MDSFLFKVLHWIGLILIIIVLFFAFSYPSKDRTEYPLTEYSCGEIKQSIISGDCLVSLSVIAGRWCYSQEEMNIHYMYRCK